MFWRRGLRKILPAIIVICVFAASGLFLAQNRQRKYMGGPLSDNSRIVSLSPSLTETLFTLGLGDNVVGVTKYCLYPAEAQTRAVVGNLYDHNYELIMQLKPDVVVLNGDQAQARAQFEHLGINVLVLENRNIEEVFSMIMELGRAFRKEAEALLLVDEMRQKLDRCQTLTASLPKVRALLCVGRSMGTNSVTQAYAAAPHTYAGTLLEYAVGVNVYDGQAAYPILTAEALIRLNPDVIIELVPEVGQGDLTVAEIIQQWEYLQEISAVRNKQVYVLTEGYTVLPGPRMVLLLEDFIRVLYQSVGEAPRP